MATMTGERVREHLLAMGEGDVCWVDGEMYVSLGTCFEVGDESEPVDAAEVEGYFLASQSYEVTW